MKNSNRHASAVMLAAGSLTLAACGGSEETVRLQPENAALVAEGRAVYQAQCAACHGADLEGQSDWRIRRADGRLPAPPHDETGHTWHHPDDVLFRLTKFGAAEMAGPAYQTDMPAYEGVLSDRQIIAALSYIKSEWPTDIQAAHDQLSAGR